jgi:arylsulfatase A-like enzyme
MGFSWLAGAGLAVLAAGCGEPAVPPVPGVSLVELLPLAELRSETSVVDFGTPESRALLLEGWGPDERPEGQSYAWGMGSHSRLLLEISRPRPLEMVAEATPFLFPGAPAQVVEVVLNGQAVGELVMDGLEIPETPRGGSVREYRLALPEGAQAKGRNELELRYAYSRRPSDVNPESRDGRDLAVSWHSLRLEPGSASQPPQAREDSLLLPHAASVSYFFRLPGGGRLEIERVAPWRDRLGANGAAPALRVEVETAGAETAVHDFSVAERSLENVTLELPASPTQPVRVSLAALPAEGAAGGLRIVAPVLRAAPDPNASLDVSLGAHPSVASQTVPRTASGPRPNILIYMVDTLRADRLGAYGYDRPTSPNIDRFARDATLFTEMTAQTSWTRPAVASVFTGLNPQVHGTNERTDAIPDSVDLLAEIFQEMGWDTAAVITNGNVGKKFGFDRGFQVFNWLRERAQLPEVHQLSDKVNEQAFPWLENRSPERPFLLYLHTTDPHGPYMPRSPYREQFAATVTDPSLGSNDRIAELGRVGADADDEVVKALSDLYDAEIAFNDAAFGLLLDKLRELGLYESTLIVLLSDHGEEFGEHHQMAHGKSLFDEQLKVPLVIRFPDGRGVGDKAHSMARQIDILPTLLDYVGADIPPAVQGRSLLPAVTAGEASIEEVSYAYLDLDARHLESVSTVSHKLISYLSSPTSLASREELFDLESDAAELVDIAEDDVVWKGYLKSLLLFRRQFWQPLDAPQVEADEELKRRLRAAGYLQ